jgi:VWFA-related protein
LTGIWLGVMIHAVFSGPPVRSSRKAQGPFPAVAFALLVALVSAALVRAQQDLPPVFRARIEAVEIDAFVTDARGNPVIDLTINDFELLEDGIRQAITSVSMIDIPIERAERSISATAIEPDVFTNHGPEGRLYVFALDEVEPAMALRTRHFMRRFVEQHLAANDVAAVVWMGRGLSSNTQDFTSNRRLLLDAIDRFQGGFPKLDLNPLSPEPRGLSRTAMESDPLSQARAFRALAEFMAKLHGRRKTLMWITEQIGDAYEVLDYAGGVRSLVFDAFHAAMTAATRGNVSVYPINPRGLDPEGTGAEFLDQMANFRALSEATGGRALTNSNSFDQFFERIVRENSSYYMLGFAPTNERRDGRYRRIQVRVKRPGLVVRARDGYVAPLREAPAAPARARDGSGGLVASVAEAIGLPVVNRAVPMAVFAAPFKGDGRNARVAVAIELDPDRLGLVRRDDTMAGDIQVALTAISAAGKVIPPQHFKVALALTSDAYERARTAGLRVLSELALPPGRYQLRVAAGNVNGPAGAVMHDLDVPDFSRGPLVMSGLALSSDRTSGIVTSSPRQPPRDILPAPPTTVREFQAGDRLTLYSEVYENLRRAAAHTVTVKAVLRTENGRVVQAIEENRSSKDADGRSGSYRFATAIPLNVAPGIYAIRIEARANVTGSPTVSRDVQIRVK